MQVVLNSGPIYSHFAPMVVLVAEAIRNAGHEIAVATGPSLTGDLDRLGLPHLSLCPMLPADQSAADPDRARRHGFIPKEMAKPASGAAFGRLFAGEVALGSVEDLVAVAAGFQPDLVILENAERGAYLFAEKIGVPCVTLDTTAALSSARRRVAQTSRARLSDCGPWRPRPPSSIIRGSAGCPRAGTRRSCAAGYRHFELRTSRSPGCPRTVVLVGRTGNDTRGEQSPVLQALRRRRVSPRGKVAATGATARARGHTRTARMGNDRLRRPRDGGFP
jgi:hypothetical protein